MRVTRQGAASYKLSGLPSQAGQIWDRVAGIDVRGTNPLAWCMTRSLLSEASRPESGRGLRFGATRLPSPIWSGTGNRPARNNIIQ